MTSFREAAVLALKDEDDQNCMWNFARALKAFEKTVGSKIATHELGAAINDWKFAAEEQNKLPSNFTRSEYLGDLTNCWKLVKSPLGSNVLEEALKRIQPLPQKPNFDHRVERLAELCKELQKFSKTSEFYLSYRDAARVMDTTDPYAAKNAFGYLENNWRHSSFGKRRAAW